MSASNAAAKKRRAIISPASSEFVPNIGGAPYNSQRTPPPPPSSSTQVQQSNGVNMSNRPSSTQGLTLQQVISLIDNRLINLEKSVIDINKKQSDSFSQISSGYPESSVMEEIETNFSKQNELNIQSQENFKLMNESLNDYDSRFEILANEISDLKTILLKLHSYTMDVNKMLLEEKQQFDSIASNISELIDDPPSLVVNDMYSLSKQENTTYSIQDEYVESKNNMDSNEDEMMSD